MTNTFDVKVPDIGDFADVEVIEVLVQVGQKVTAEESLITLETDKAAMDVPSPQDGEVSAIAVSVGDKVSKGDAILTLQISAPAEAPEHEPTQMVSALDNSDAATVAVTALPELVDIRVPNLGDFNDVEVIEVLIKAGDKIDFEAPVVTLETDKAAMDVPSSVQGTVREVLVKTGDSVSAGDVLAHCEGVLASDASEPKTANGNAAVQQDTAQETQAQESAPTVTATVAVPPTTGAVPAALPAIDEGTFKLAHASPAVRKFARELGVDLGRVRGTGIKKRITAADVKAFVKSIMSGATQMGAAPALPAVPKVDYAKFGEIELKPLTRIQKISGPRLHASWVNVPHVTHNDLGDFTDTEQRRKAMKAQALEEGVRLTPLAFVMRACAMALLEMPLFNSSLADDGKSLVMKKYINLGFAADTPNGLMVPVIHNAQKMSVLELAKELDELSAQARDGKLPATKMQGASFTVSSLGGIGGTSFTPIINAPEVAILGVSRAQITAVYIDGKFQPRLMLPLSLSYDHRVIDGASAARFTALLAKLVSDPEGLLA